MRERWALIVADFRREYHLSPDQLGAMSLQEFSWLLQGLSEHSRVSNAWAEAPKNVYDPAQIAAIRAAARR